MTSHLDGRPNNSSDVVNGFADTFAHVPAQSDSLRLFRHTKTLRKQNSTDTGTGMLYKMAEP